MIPQSEGGSKQVSLIIMSKIQNFVNLYGKLEKTVCSWFGELLGGIVILIGYNFGFTLCILQRQKKYGGQNTHNSEE